MTDQPQSTQLPDQASEPPQVKLMDTELIAQSRLTNTRLRRWLLLVRLQLTRMKRRVRQAQWYRLLARTTATASSRLTGGKGWNTINLLKLAAGMLLIGVLTGMVGFFVLFAWYSRDLPQPGQVVRREGFSTRILDRSGQVLYDLYDQERRNPVTIDQIPVQLQQATIAIEDKDFYNHRGFDVLTVVRIPYNLVARNRIVGGSTLTQQLVKNVLLTSDRTISRKFKEFVLALQIERTFTKEEILEMYLNEAPYGGTAWGVGAAAEIYFNKTVAELSLVESAILAGLPQRPSAYSPFAGRTSQDGTLLWQLRTQGVLRRMLEDGFITQEEYNQSLIDLESISFASGDTQIKAPHFVFYVQDQLEELFGAEVLEQGGFEVTTTLDLELQEQAQQIVTEEIEQVRDLDISNGAAIAVDPRSGEILAMVGSADYFNDEIGGQFNVVVDGLRQPGSSIKPVTYLAMLQQGYTPASMLLDTPTVFATNDQVEPYEPNNYDGLFRGPVSMRDSLGSSLNITAVKGVALVGVETMLQTAYDMGFVTLEPTAENLRRLGLSVTLGGGEVHLLDTAVAYSSFANGGTRVEPVSILEVTDQDGRVLFEHRFGQGRQVMTEGEAFLINHMLSDNNARLLAFGANSLLNTGRPIAVKTGTTNDQRDNWTIGWSQELLVGTWVGNNDNSAMLRVASGITGASPIWRRIMFAGLERGYGTPEWEVPSSVEQVIVDSISGYPAHSDFPSRQEYVIKGTLPSLPDPIHTKLKLCRGENKLANDARILADDYDEKEFIVLQETDPVSQDGRNRWQEGVQQWLETQDDPRYNPPTDYCGEDDDFIVKMHEPDDEEEYDDKKVKVEVDAGDESGIEWIEIVVDGEVFDRVDGRSYDDEIELERGSYEIFARVKNRDGDIKESSSRRIGVDGADWDEPDPTPTPSPSSSPTPTPSPSSSPAPSPIPSPTPDDESEPEEE